MSQKEFLLLFNELEQILQKEYGVEDGVFQLMEQAKLEPNLNPVKQHWEVLDIARRLRNIIVHETNSSIVEVATPSAEIMETLEKVVYQYRHPLSVREFLAKEKREEVIAFSVNQSLSDLLGIMKTKGYSQFPLFDEEGYVGVVSDKSLANWLAHSVKEGGEIHERLTNLPLSELIAYEERKDAVARFYKEDSLLHLVSLFEQSRVKVVLICEKKSLDLASSNDIFGILTSHDVSALRRYINS